MTQVQQQTQPSLRSKHLPTTTYKMIGDTEVPWIFENFDDEYQALRNRGVVFDHSSVGLISVAGENALGLLQKVMTRDFEYLADDQCLPSLILDEAGRLQDAVVVYGLEDRYLVETGFGHGSRVWEHLVGAAGAGVELTDLRTSWSVLGIEGPYVWEVAGQLFGPEMTTLPYQTTLELDWDAAQVRFARSGFSGEYGYKILGPSDALASIWSQLAEQVRPAGQGVLESVMTEVRQPIAHREVERPENVIESGINWLIDRNKGGYVGRDAVEAMWAEGPRTLRLGGRSAAEVDPGAAVLAGDTAVGEVAMCSPSPGIGGYVVLLQVDPRFAAAGLELEVASGDDPVPVTTLSSPYVVPASWSVPIF